MCGRFFFSLFPSEARLYEQLFGIARPMFWNLIPKNAPKFEPTRTWFNTRKEKLEAPYQKNLLRCCPVKTENLKRKKVKGIS